MEELLTQIEELISNRQFAKLRKLLSTMNFADIAPIIEQLPDQYSPVLFRLLPKETAADVFVEIESDTQEKLIKSFSDKELKEVVDELFVDDTVDIIEEMPASVVKRILKHTDSETRKAINMILQYPKDSAGSIMTTEYVDLKKDLTVKEAFARIRKTGLDKETIYTCYVTDNNRKLIGLVTVKTLLLSETDDTINDIMETNIIHSKTLDDKELVAKQFEKYDFLAVPIVDNEGRLVGIVTVDDAMDVMQEENTEDIEKMAAITPTDKPYLKMSVFETYLKRIPWLLILMISATFTGLIISSFENALAAQVALTAFIPMLMDTGGNAGSQASVTIIRGLALGEIESKNIFKIIYKELRVAFLIGLSLGIVNFIKIMLIDKVVSGVSLTVALVVCITLVFTVVIAKFVGCTLPIIAKKLKFDPAVMASPFITTIVDAFSLMIYFQIAKLLLKI